MIATPLHQLFTQSGLHPAFRWHCEPAAWSIDPAQACLRVEPDADTDFWQRTHYGIEADNGHFLFTPVTGDFVLTAMVAFRPVHQYDQAGLMVRISPACWLKTSVEYEPEGPNKLGVVVTNSGYSDWSTQSIPRDIRALWFRIRGEADAFLVDTSLDGKEWRQIRLAYLLERQTAAAIACGVYACSPKGIGYRAEFHCFSLVPGRLP